MARSLSLMTVLLLMTACSLSAADFAGTYTGQIPEGPIKLTLQEAESVVTGTMTDTDGSTFVIEGESAGSKLAGSMYNDMFGAFFEAQLSGVELNFTLIPVDLLGNPMPNAATTYQLTRADRETPSLGKKPVPKPFGNTPGTLEADPWIGTFSDGSLTLTLTESEGRYTGHAQLEGVRYPISAQKKDASTIEGSYSSQGIPQLFSAILNGDQLTVVTGAERYQLTRQAHTPPAAPSFSLKKPATGSDPKGGPITQRQIHDTSLGVGFDPPAGWKHQQNGEVFLLGHQTIPGFIAVEWHEYNNLDAIRAEAMKGYMDENGTHLQVAGQVTSFGANGIQATFTGTIQHQAAKGYAISVLSPFGGGITIMAGVTASSYTDDYQRYVETIANSATFAKPTLSASAKEWLNRLTGCRLTYMDSYSSSGYDGSYAGYSDQIEIDLCPGNYFIYGDQSSMSVDGGGGSGYGASAYGHSQDAGSGEWRVVGQGDQTALKLLFHNGDVYEYTLSLEDGKTFLNGNRYFRICAGEGTPDQQPNCR